MEPNLNVENTKNSGLKSFFELIRYVVVALIVVFIVRTYIAQPFVVSGSSMYPTFEDREYLIVDEISYLFHDPERGDVVVFHYPKNPDQFFIKRIIGLPGEVVTIMGSTVVITDTNGVETVLEEPYVENISSNDQSYKLNEDEYFVMGDNRGASSDSRSWGNLPKENIVGQPFVRLFPASSITLMPGKFDQSI